MRGLCLVCVVVLALVLLLVQCGLSESKHAGLPPLPVLPIPTAAQLQWHRREIIMFFHFGMNTFTDSEWGTGKESPSLFRPSALNTWQWMEAAEEAGASLVILVAKHHDGFCLWPSDYTRHSIEWSPWKGGKGDLVGEFVATAKAKGLDVGLYLSPWDRHEKSYGQEREYNELYLAQLQELLSRYGSISEIWFDGAKGKKAKNMTYYFEDWFKVTKQLQPDINIFSDAGPDIRWVGDEQGYAGSTCWSPINRTMLHIGAAGITNYLNSGDAAGTEWVPPECDVSIRKGWFWHESEKPKNLTQLLDIYYKSVGRNCVLLLNVPPNTTGLVSDVDLKRLHHFRKALTTIFSTNLAATSTSIRASSEKLPTFPARNVLVDDGRSYWVGGEGGGGKAWLELEWGVGSEVEFNVVRVEEAVWLGQRVKRHEVWVDGRVVVGNGTTVGYKRLHRLERTVRGVRKVRIVFGKWKGEDGPLVSAVGLHYDPFWKGKWAHYEPYSHPDS